MPDQMPGERLDAAMTRVGIALTPAERESILGVVPLLDALLARLRTPRGVEVEPATVFAPPQAQP
jgi:hypothetical protein